MLMMRNLDGDGVKLRRSHRLQRRVYLSRVCGGHMMRYDIVMMFIIHRAPIFVGIWMAMTNCQHLVLQSTAVSMGM